jgi:hypothetical protein
MVQIVRMENKLKAVQLVHNIPCVYTSAFEITLSS